MNYEMMGNGTTSALPIFEGQNRDFTYFQDLPVKYDREHFTYSINSALAGKLDYSKNPVLGDKSKNDSHANAIWLAGARRLEPEQLNWVPFNDLEVSQTIASDMSIDVGLVSLQGKSIANYYYHCDFIPPLDYFATLQAMPADGVDDLIKYITILSFPDITGISFQKNYLDPDLARVAQKYNIPYAVYPYRGRAEVNSMYESFWEMYYMFVENFRAKIVSYVMKQSGFMQLMAGQFDIDSLGSVIMTMRNTILNDLISGKGYVDSLVNMPHKLQRKLSWDDNGPLPIDQQKDFGTPIERSLSQLQGLWVDSDLVKYGVIGGKSSAPFIPAARIRELWNNAILPAKIQLDNMIAVWNRLKNSPATLTERDVDNLYNIEKNLFLGYDPIATAKMKKVMLKQLAVSPLVAELPPVVEAPKDLQVMYQPVLDIEKSKSQYFMPMFSYSQQSSKGKIAEGGGDGKKSNLPLILAGLAAAAVVYYSYK